MPQVRDIGTPAAASAMQAASMKSQIELMQAQASKANAEAVKIESYSGPRGRVLDYIDRFLEQGISSAKDAESQAPGLLKS